MRLFGQEVLGFRKESEMGVSGDEVFERDDARRGMGDWGCSSRGLLLASGLLLFRGFSGEEGGGVERIDDGEVRRRNEFW